MSSLIVVPQYDHLKTRVAQASCLCLVRAVTQARCLCYFSIDLNNKKNADPEVGVLKVLKKVLRVFSSNGNGVSWNRYDVFHGDGYITFFKIFR